jgi:hypothetical protein
MKQVSNVSENPDHPDKDLINDIEYCQKMRDLN